MCGCLVAWAQAWTPASKGNSYYDKTYSPNLIDARFTVKQDRCDQQIGAVLHAHLLPLLFALPLDALGWPHEEGRQIETDEALVV